MENLIIDAVKTGIMSLVVSKVVRSIGQHDMAQMIAASGWLGIGADAWQLGKMFADWITPLAQKFGKDVSELANVVSGVTEFLGKLGIGK